MTKNGTKNTTQPRKNWSFAWQILYFLLKKTAQPRKERKFCIQKWPKNWPKRPPSPAKPEVLHEKKCNFLVKKTSQLRKKLKFCMKKWQKNNKKVPKKSAQPRKNWSFAWKKLSFFTQKYHPAPQKTDFFNEKMTKSWQPPTSQNVLTHNKIFLHFFTYIVI